MLKLNGSELDNLLELLNLYPGQRKKFYDMLDKLNAQCKPNTSIASNLSPMNFYANARPSVNQSTRYSAQDVELNLKLKQELLKAKKEISRLEVIKNNKDSLIPECINNFKIDKNFIGKSFDSSRIRSTLHNMDLEEICKCFARVIQSLCFRESIKVNPLIKEFNAVFVDQDPGLSDENDIYNWCRSIISKGKLDKDVLVGAVVYLERYIEKSSMSLAPNSWKKLVFISLFTAGNGKHIDQGLYGLYSQEEIERMKRSFLTLIEFNLNIKQSEYAHAYFLLRTYVNSKDKSVPIKPVKLNEAITLYQNTSENVNKEAVMKSI